MNNLPNKTSRRRLTSLLFVGLALSTFYARSFYYHELDAFLVIEHSGGVQCASFSPDGFRILTATGDGNAILWDMATLRRNRNGKITPGVSGIMRHESPVHCAIFSPYEKYITSLSDSGAVSLCQRIRTSPIGHQPEYPRCNVLISSYLRGIAVPVLNYQKLC